MTTTLAAATKHPAKFNDIVLAWLKDQNLTGRLLDPFAGVGKIHQLDNRDEPRVGSMVGLYTFGVEIEPEWAAQHPQTVVGDALNLQYEDAFFDHVVTSPCYGNRMADHHEAQDKSRRNTYRHQLGRPLHKDSSAGLAWGKDYRAFHTEAWGEVARALKPSGSFYLNIKDHIRGGKRQLVTEWHIRKLVSSGLFEMIDWYTIPMKGLTYGANRERVDHESIVHFRRTK